MRRRVFARVDLTLACVVFACWLGAAGPLLPAPRAERSVDGDEELLPIHETEAERALAALQQRIRRIADQPPVGPIRNVAEFEPCTGVLIRYPLGVGYEIINEMAEDVTVHVIVSSEHYSAAVTNFLANSVDTSRCDFIVEPNNSIWTRDYGPWFVFDGNGEQVIIDHFYNRTARPDDNLIPVALGEEWRIPVVTHDLWHSGGNYMTEGRGLSFSTDMVWDENWEMTPQEIAQLFLDYYGVEVYNVIPDISEGGIHHIDTWGKLLDEETVLMKQVDPSHPDYARIEANAATIASLVNQYGRDFRVVRVFCPTIPSGNVAPYTNSLILNNKVLVPLSNLPAADAAALQVYRDHMPGYEVVGFPGGWLSDDALHCRVMGVHDRYMLRVDHDPLQGASPMLPIPVMMYVDDRSETGIDMSETKLYWRVAGAPTFAESPAVLTSEPDWYRAKIPVQPPGTRIEYYMTARDMTGRVSSRPRTAPLAWHSFSVDQLTGAHPTGAVPKLTLAVAPSPFQYRSVVRFNLATAGPARVAVYDVRGREVARLADRSFTAGGHEVEWMGRTANGEQAPSGVYFVVLKSAGERITRRVVLLR
jgi:agmatine/peptidylarginine deiminase